MTPPDRTVLPVDVRHAVITGTGHYAPPRVVTNADLEALLGVSVEPFVSETLGIRERRFCAPHESTVACPPPGRRWRWRGWSRRRSTS
jgi:hypothetical protein